MSAVDIVPAGTLSSEVPSAGTLDRQAPPGVPAPVKGRMVLVLILLLVNSGAMWGQAGWALAHIVPARWDTRAGLALALVFALALELIGVFLATMADEADARQLPAGGYRLGSYAAGVTMGALNASHFWHAGLAAAVSFGLLSAVSPFLWGIYSTVRRGTRVAPSRRFWHPIDSVRLIRFMAWEGIASEDDAIRERVFRKSEDVAPVSPAGAVPSAVRGRLALDLKEVSPSRSWESIAAELGVTARQLLDDRKAARA